MYPDPITPKSFPALLEAVSYDPFGLMPRRFPGRPHVFVTPSQLENTRRLIAAGGWPAEAFRLLLARADAPDAFPARPPARPDAPLAAGTAATALRNACAAALTGQARYRTRALALLRRLARAYPAWPPQPGLGRLGIEDSGETHFITRLARTYDLLAAEPLAPADDRLFRRLLEATRAASDAGNHPACGNHGTAILLGRLAAAVALHDRPGIHDALYGCRRAGQWRYGIVHQLRHDILNDGLHWERAPGYHGYMLYLLADIADLLLPLGVNLWTQPLPPLWQDDGQDLHRDYGTRLGTKTLKSAFDALFHLAFPNGDLSTLADSRLENLRGLFVWGVLLDRAYAAYRDPRYAALINRAESEIPPAQRAQPGLPLSLQSPWITELEFLRIPRARYPRAPFAPPADARFSLAGEHRHHASLFPVYGAAVLRANPRRKRAPAAFLFWGPHAAGHQSPAALHLDLHADGEKITDAPRLDNRGYADPLYLTWARTTIAHNTVTVDRRPMFPYDFETDSIWETDRWRDTISDGECLLFQPDGAGFQAVRACNERVYPGVRLDRTVIVTGAGVLDVFRVVSDRVHTFDWALHVVGTPDRPPRARPASFCRERGYRHFSGITRLPVGQPLELCWQRARGRTHASVSLPPNATAWLARDPIPPPEKMHTIGEIGPVTPRHSLIVRARAKAALFLSAWSFHGGPVPLRRLCGDAASTVVLRTGSGRDARTWTVPLAHEPVVRGRAPDQPIE